MVKGLSFVLQAFAAIGTILAICLAALMFFYFSVNVVYRIHRGKWLR
ncbi:MAG TPA: hypothetical protein VIE67_11675 [Rudaea sp.]